MLGSSSSVLAKAVRFIASASREYWYRLLRATIVVTTVSVALGDSQVGEVPALNLLALQTSWSILGGLSLGSSPDLTGGAAIAKRSCEVKWLTFQQERWTIDETPLALRGGLEGLFPCPERYLRLLEASLPSDEAVAARVTEERPRAAWGWFWLGRARRMTGASGAADAFRRGLMLDPSNGEAWIEVAQLYALFGNASEALAAYLAACRNGDPHRNGCWGAGRTAESLGDLRSAIEYYRLSRWDVALKRASHLAGQICPGRK